MRRVTLAIATVVALCATSAALAAGPASGPSATAPADGGAASRGLTYAGLAPAAAGSRLCQGLFVLVPSASDGVERCTHGPDPAPPGVDVRTRQPKLVGEDSDQSGATGPGTAAAGATVPCYEDGVSGNRVQAVYAFAGDVRDRYAELLPSLRQWAADAEQVFSASAAETGGVRHLRFVTDGGCNISVAKVELSTAGDDTMSATVQQLADKGFNRFDRKYLVWVDANVYCGIGQIYGDSDPTSANTSNGDAHIPGEIARVDTGCWGLASSNQSVEAHELMHTMGGVQTNAPHATNYSHCWDESDRMCYDDGGGDPMRQFCPTSHENRFDCNHDDYYSTAPPAGSYLSTFWNVASSSFLASTGSTNSAPQPMAGTYRSMTPARLVDTRRGSGNTYAGRTLAPGETLDVQVTNVQGVPPTATAVVLNVTATNPSWNGYLTVFPSGATRPNASSLNFVTNQTVPNMVQVQLGNSGKVSIYNSSGTTDVVADVAGYFLPTTAVAGLYNPTAPARVLDTRAGSGAPYAGQRLGAGGSLNVKVTGVGGVPATGVSAVVLNVTVTNPTSVSFLTVYPTGVSRPVASNLNFVPGQTVPNRVTVPVGSGGSVTLFNNGGSVDVVADVGGWYTDGTSPTATGSTFTGMTPKRITDTRPGSGAQNAGRTLGTGSVLNVAVAGVGSVPGTTSSTPPKAAVLNVTATNTSADSFLTVFPGHGARPTASDLNWVPGLTVPNLVVVKLGADGTVDLYNRAGNVDVVVDVIGFYS